MRSPVRGGVSAQELTDEAVGHLQELLRIDTTNPPGHETRAASYLAEVLEREGYEPSLIESSAGRGNVVVRYRGTGERKPLLLYCHLDVVTAEAESWSHDPFSGDIAEGCVWGRGAVDMKGMVAQQLMVMLLLQRNAVSLKRDVIFAATADEEVGGAAGMGFLVDRYPQLISAEYGLSEGGGSTMYIAGRPFYDVRTAEKGTCRFRMRAHGNPGHASVPREKTALVKLSEAILKLSSASFPFTPTPTVEALCKILSRAVDFAVYEGNMTEDQFNRLLQMLPADFRHYLHAITRDTVVPTIVRAGEKINVIAGSAEARVDGRYLPGHTAEEFLSQVRAIVGEGYDIEPIDVSLPLEGSVDGPLYETIVRVISGYVPEATILPVTLAGATDAKHVAKTGAQCLGFSPLKIDEGFPIERMVHGHNERIPIDGFGWGVEVLYEIVRDFCSS